MKSSIKAFEDYGMRCKAWIPDQVKKIESLFIGEEIFWK